MKKFLFTALMALFAEFASAEVTITNLTVAQRPGTKLMDITYDVSSTATNTVTISLTVSNGASKVNATNLTGAVGAGVATGTNRLMIWNVAPDWNGNVADLSFTVQADDGKVSCVVAKTGQTTSYRTGDDGDLEPGVAWPNPRFSVLTNGADKTVIDNLTGLEWVKAPHTLSGNSGSTNWYSAIDLCNNLIYAGHSDWRLPSVKELESLVNCGTYNPALPAGHPFAGVQYGYYWSGTSNANVTDVAWSVHMSNGSVGCFSTDARYVWPVRGGQ